jgi:hypothetical protein
MATYEQKPGVLNIVANRGDELGVLVDLSVATTGYTWSSEVYSLVDGNSVASPTITVVDAAAGQVNFAMTESQTAALPVGTFGVRIVWTASGDVRRIGTDGLLEIIR